MKIEDLTLNSNKVIILIANDAEFAWSMTPFFKGPQEIAIRDGISYLSSLSHHSRDIKLLKFK